MVESEVDSRMETIASPPTANEAATPTSPLGPASTIGAFTVLQQLGQGAMGVVYATYDAKLDRKVALKVLRRHQSSRGRERMLREAQALARVSHPHVVQVHEVGEHDGQVYIAMEFVRGQTLRKWAKAGSRGWREVVGLYVQAGRGLGAAHAAGIIHRDFKPDNVMIGDDGRVRVMDFGLARTEGVQEIPESAAISGRAGTSTSPTLTAEGTLLGTPAYMAPEQYRGEELDPQADQFAFCVALFEAVYGLRPFRGKSARVLEFSILSGKIEETPRGRAPRWLRRVILRGLAAAPKDRWPSMDALLAAIDRGQSLARFGFGAAAVAVVGLALAGAALVAEANQNRREAACAASGARVDEIWNEQAKAAVKTAFVATGVADAAAMADRVFPWIDNQAEAWRGARTQACLATEIHETWSTDTFARSLWCLDQRWMELEALIQSLTKADRAMIQSAVPTAASLDAIAPCRDVERLMRLPTPPVGSRDQARAIRAELAQSNSLRAAGDMDAAMQKARDALAQAQELGWPPLVAAARFDVGYLLDRQGNYEEAAHELEEAGFTAAEAGAFGVAASAATYLTTVVGNHLARFEEAKRWSRFAGLALLQLEPQPGPRTATNLIGVSILHAMKGELDQAQQLQERALAIQIQNLGDEHLHVGSTLHNLALTHLSRGELTQALEVNGRALEIREAALGPDHNDVTRTLNNRSIILRNLGEYAEARALTERVLAATERDRGPDHPDVAVVLSNLANLHLMMGTTDQVLPLQTRALEIREAKLGPDHPQTAASLGNLASYYQTIGSYKQAGELHQRALAIREQVFGPKHRLIGESLGGLGLSELYRDDVAAAQEHLTRGLAMLEEVTSREHPALAPMLCNLGEVALETRDYAAANSYFGRALEIIEANTHAPHPNSELAVAGLARVARATHKPALAVELATRAVAIGEAQELAPLDLADARFLLAQALWEAPAEQGGNRTRAVEEARRARDGFKGHKGARDNHTEVVAWLAARDSFRR